MKYTLLLSFLFLITACIQTEKKYNTWNNYGGSKDNIHFSSLNQIDTSNVGQLQLAWIFNTGDADSAAHSQIQCNPIIIDSIMYLTSPTLKLFAVNAATGKKIWEYDPDPIFGNKKSLNFVLNNSRGVTYWTDARPDDPVGRGKNDKRIFYVASSYLHCIDATNGQLIRNFGDSGLIDLHNDLGREVQDLFVTATSPGIIYKDIYILGSRVDEGAAAAPGHIRAFDVRTGKLRWIFHTIPHPGEAGYETWEDPEAYKHIGGANSWSGFTLDEKRGILFAPTGSASYDFYGGKRKGQNLFANCLLALDAETGRRKWHFQFIHHDLWDWDLPAPPVLVTIEKGGKKIDAVAQTTKHGMVWLFERETGNPIYPINEMSVDTITELIGEKVWPTQPMPTFIKPFVRQSFSVNDINPYLPDSSIAKLKKDLEGYRYGKMFLPPGKKTAVELPGFDGGAEWGGPSYDPQTGLLYVNANEMGWLVTMRDVQSAPMIEESYYEAGLRLYNKYCMTCHGAKQKSTSEFPILDNIQSKYNSTQIKELLSTGRRRMPSFNYITTEEKEAIISYLFKFKEEKRKFVRPPQPQDTYRNLPYAMTGYNKFLSPEGYPAIAPPWGTITAIDLNTGEHVWKTTLGEYPELKEKGVPPTGTENYGGPVVTAGGLLFIAASRDGMIRAYNKTTGKLLWEYELPAPGFATPSVYAINGRQFLVIACGGGKLKTKSGDAYVAFALPGKK